ncbi:hypothetical protein [uncultured Thomasclavelia sp.]|uniref:hypothetical protein n=1 Tax=uncultured Thomasclavelia sp. TaxID=3025759 RepID=UPI00280BD15F|nr:hypothetical protein [uncultured Thomasclavelia sp.]
MSTIYILLTGTSIIGIKIIDIILSLFFDSISFSLAWKIGGIGYSSSSRKILHWTSRIVIYTILVIGIQAIF